MKKTKINVKTKIAQNGQKKHFIFILWLENLGNCKNYCTFAPLIRKRKEFRGLLCQETYQALLFLSHSTLLFSLNLRITGLFLTQNALFYIFFSKKFGQVKKKQYFCTRYDFPRFPLDQRTRGGLRVFREIIVPSVRIGRSNIYT